MHISPHIGNLDNLCSKHLTKEPFRILRVYGHAVESREYPGPYCERSAFQVSDSEYKRPQWAQRYALHCIVRDGNSETPQNIRAMEKMFSDEHKKGHIPGAEMCQEWKDLVDEAEQAILGQPFDVVLCTCNEAASNRIVKHLKRQYNPKHLQCIIDESGMAYEPEAIVPMSLCEHVILLGDHKQLQPVIQYKPAKYNGLTTSLFERYASSRKGKVCMMLDVQYRMVRSSYCNNYHSIHIGLKIRFYSLYVCSKTKIFTSALRGYNNNYIIMYVAD